MITPEFASYVVTQYENLKMQHVRSKDQWYALLQSFSASLQSRLLTRKDYEILLALIGCNNIFHILKIFIDASSKPGIDSRIRGPPTSTIFVPYASKSVTIPMPILLQYPYWVFVTMEKNYRELCRLQEIRSLLERRIPPDMTDKITDHEDLSRLIWDTRPHLTTISLPPPPTSTSRYETHLAGWKRLVNATADEWMVQNTTPSQRYTHGGGEIHKPVAGVTIRTFPPQQSQVTDKKVGFGQYRNTLFSEVPQSYINWLETQWPWKGKTRQKIEELMKYHNRM